MTNWVQWVGHSTVLVSLGGARFVTDPILSARVGLLIARKQPPALDARGLAPLDAILVSHGHLDHMDLPSLAAIRAAAPAGQQPVVVVAHDCDGLVRELGFEDVRVLRWGQATTLPSGAVVHAIPATHRHGRVPFGPRTGYQGYVVEHGGRSVMFAGDTAACRRYGEVGARFAIDVALLPIGAYAPPPLRMMHMNPDDALDALEQLRARVMVPIHHSTFRLSAEPLAAPLRRLHEQAARRGLAERVRTLAHGDRFAFPT